jgi:hypothetical protein
MQKLRIYKQDLKKILRKTRKNKKVKDKKKFKI